jgi:hypothetical protein
MRTSNFALFLYLAVTPVPVTTENWKLPSSGKSSADTPGDHFSVGDIFTGEVWQVKY